MSKGYFCRKLALGITDMMPTVKKVKVDNDFNTIKVILIDGAEYEIKIKQTKNGLYDMLNQNPLP